MVIRGVVGKLKWGWEGIFKRVGNRTFREGWLGTKTYVRFLENTRFRIQLKVKISSINLLICR